MSFTWQTTARVSMAVLAVATTATTLTAQERRYIAPGMASRTDTPPYSQGVLVGNTLYLAGTIGLDANRQVPADREVEARMALDNIKRVLEEAGMTMDDLVSVQVFCSDVSLYDIFNRVYRTYFKNEFPARAFIGSGPLLFGGHFEVQGIAVKR